MDYLCSACGKKIQGDMVIYMDHTNKHVIDLIKADHPNWDVGDGLCPKCVNYYKDEINGSIFKDAPCALRIRKVKSVWQGIKEILVGKKNE